MAAGRAKMGVKYSQGTDVCVVSLAIGHWNVHPVAGCIRYLHSCLSRMRCNEKTENWAVCHCMWAGKLISSLQLDLPLDSVCNEGVSGSLFLAGDDVTIMFVW